MLAAGALVVGAYLLWRKGAPLKQPLLMLLLAVIAVVNVLIWNRDVDWVRLGFGSLLLLVAVQLASQSSDQSPQTRR